MFGRSGGRTVPHCRSARCPDQLGIGNDEETGTFQLKPMSPAATFQRETLKGHVNVEGVILAAGLSTRAGTFKPALELGGKTMLLRCIEGMEEVCGRIIVVGGHEFEKLRASVEGNPKVVFVENSRYRLGMFTSVKAGLSLVRGERCLLLPVDIPLVPNEVYRRLLYAQGEVVIPSYHGRNGHPVCIAKNVIPHILSQPDETSLREVLRTLNCRTIDVDAEEILVDIDTPEDFESASMRLARHQSSH